jgi:hypothetical protein
MLFGEEAIREVVFISAVLAGFAFAVVVQLTPQQDPRRLAAWLIGIFLVTSAVLLSSAFVGSLLLVRFDTLQANIARGMAAEAVQRAQARLDRQGTALLLPFVAGLAGFLAGIGLMGWLRSPRLGILSTLCAAVCVLIVILILAA